MQGVVAEGYVGYGDHVFDVDGSGGVDGYCRHCGGCLIVQAVYFSGCLEMVSVVLNWWVLGKDRRWAFRAAVDQ